MIPVRAPYFHICALQSSMRASEIVFVNKIALLFRNSRFPKKSAGENDEKREKSVRASNRINLKVRADRGWRFTFFFLRGKKNGQRFRMVFILRADYGV